MLITHNNVMTEYNELRRLEKWLESLKKADMDSPVADSPPSQTSPLQSSLDPDISSCTETTKIDRLINVTQQWARGAKSKHKDNGPKPRDKSRSLLKPSST